MGDISEMHKSDIPTTGTKPAAFDSFEFDGFVTVPFPPSPSPFPSSSFCHSFLHQYFSSPENRKIHLKGLGSAANALWALKKHLTTNV